MRRRLVSQSLAAAAVLGAALLGAAHEPDGRVAIRYDWLDAKAGESPEPKLRLQLTAIADLSEVKLSARVPGGIGLAVRTADRAPAPWPDEGLPLGALAAGRSIVIELDVEKPSQGGGIVGFAISGLDNGVLIQEGVGVPVGLPGIQPTVRNGALEFPAEQGPHAP